MELSRKILERWRDLSGNAAKLYTFLFVSAPRGGRLDGSFEDMARANGWSLKTLRGAIRELEAKSCITAARSTGKHVRTQIRLLNCEEHEPTPSLQGSSSQATPSQMGRSNTEVKISPSQEGSSGEPAPSQKGSSSLVPAFDVAAPTHIAAPSKQLEGIPGGDSARVAAAIEKRYLAGELSDVACQTLRYLRFDADPASLSRGFVSVLDWLGKRANLPLPGRLATMILDRCLEQQCRRRSDGKNSLLYAWPPGFQKHRDRLRKAERAAGRQEHARAVA